MRRSKADIVREYGPFAGADHVAGVTFDGQSVWFAAGDALRAFDPHTGDEVRSLAVPAHAGSAFDGTYLYQIANAEIQKLDPASGRVVSTIPVPWPGDTSGLAWADGVLWVGHLHGRTVHAIDPRTGATLRTLASNRFVTGVTWVDGELWHGTWEGDESDIRRIDPKSGEVLECVEMPAGTGVSGLESDGKDRFYCGAGKREAIVRAVRRPARGESSPPRRRQDSARANAGVAAITKVP